MSMQSSPRRQQVSAGQHKSDKDASAALNIKIGATPRGARLSRRASLRSTNSETDQLNLVHEELEKLNIATDVINKLELQLDEARNGFREIQSSWSQHLEKLAKKLGACIDKSRPYYEARLIVRIRSCLF